MSTAVKNTVIRVITRKMSQGETFDEIVARYPKLTAEEVEELREAVGV